MDQAEPEVFVSIAAVGVCTLFSAHEPVHLFDLKSKTIRRELPKFESDFPAFSLNFTKFQVIP